MPFPEGGEVLVDAAYIAACGHLTHRPVWTHGAEDLVPMVMLLVRIPCDSCLVQLTATANAVADALEGGPHAQDA